MSNARTSTPNRRSSAKRFAYFEGRAGSPNSSEHLKAFRLYNLDRANCAKSIQKSGLRSSESERWLRFRSLGRPASARRLFSRQNASTSSFVGNKGRDFFGALFERLSYELCERQGRRTWCQSPVGVERKSRRKKVE